MAKILLNGAQVAMIPAASVSGFIAAGAAEGEFDPEALEIVYTSAEQKALVRSAIEDKAGDTLSLLGTASDASALAIYVLAVIISKLSAAESLADVRASAEPFADLASGLLSRIEAGEVQFPFMVKGLDAVVADIEARASAVSGVLSPVS